MVDGDSLTERQRALYDLLEGDPTYAPRYAVTQPGKPEKDAIWLELSRRYVVHARHAREDTDAH